MTTEIKTIAQLEEEVNKIFLIEDKGIILMMVASIIANRLTDDPVWLMLVGPSSCGKSEMIMMADSLPFVFGISDITTNTFLSGAKSTGNETSLLRKMPIKSIMTFKDFTSILSKNREARSEIMKQLREIYDGSYIKRTGTGDDLVWNGKLGAIGGVTESIFRYYGEMADMGHRFIMYSIDQPDRKEMTIKKLKNDSDIKLKRDYLKKCFTDFIGYIIEKMDEYIDIQINDDLLHGIVQVSDLAAQARSAVETDFKTGEITFVQKAEMPTRIAGQLKTIGRAFIIINKISLNDPNVMLTEEQEQLIYKTALDSIPRTRRDIIIPLSEYVEGGTTAGIATFLDLPTKSVSRYLTHLNGLGIIKRKKKAGLQGDIWVMREKYLDIMNQYYNIKPKKEMLLGKDVEPIQDDLLEDVEKAKTQIQNKKMNPEEFEEYLQIDMGL